MPRILEQNEVGSILQDAAGRESEHDSGARKPGSSHRTVLPLASDSRCVWDNSSTGNAAAVFYSALGLHCAAANPDPSEERRCLLGFAKLALKEPMQRCELAGR